MWLIGVVLSLGFVVKSENLDLCIVINLSLECACDNIHRFSE